MMLSGLKNRWFSRLAAALCLAALAACNGEPARHAAVVGGETMGTTYTVKYIAEQGQNLPAPEQVKADMEALLQEVNRQMSTYQADSEISRFNRMKADAGAMPVSADFAAVVTEAARLHRVTEGALDVTVGPLVNLWGFGPDKSITRAPSPAETARAMQWVGMDKIHLHPAGGAEKSAALSKRADGVCLDLSAIAKGFGVDKLAQYLDGIGVRHYLVEIGGELRAKGRNPQNRAWNVGIERPQFGQTQSSQIVVALDNRALATSGDYRNFHTDESGRRLSHIINPQNRQPISHNLASVSVVADSAMTADGLSTGLFVLGEDKALEVAEKNGLAVFLIIKTANGYETKMSPAFKQMVQ